MRDYMAPMEGITNVIYRNAYHRCFHPMDKYFTPFITGKQNKRLSQKEIDEISPEKNQGMYLVPQILASRSEDFIMLARIFMDYGYKEVNLNLGCPSPTVTAKGKGAGFLGEPQKLERFLDEIFSKPDLKISIKTRIGTDYEEEWDSLLKIYQKFPIEELIIHPRLLTDYYKKPIHPDAYRMALHNLKIPLCYNGDLFSKKDYEMLMQQFPETDTVMYGRGLIRNPGLADEIREGKLLEKKVLLNFHDSIYEAYKEQLSGDRNVLFRMKELWAYLIESFDHADYYRKKIRKAQKCRDYERIVEELFSSCPLAGESSQK